MRQRPVRGIGLVLADDPEDLTAPVVADDGYGRAKMHLAAIARRRDQLRACPPRSPVTQVASCPCERRAIVRRVRRSVLLLKARDFGLDSRKPLRGHEVRMRRNGPIRQLFDRVLHVFDECSTHGSGVAIGECFWFLFVGPALSALPEPAACLYGMSEAIWKCWAKKLAALQECDWRELFQRERVHLYWVRYDVPSMRDSGACDA